MRKIVSCLLIAAILIITVFLSCDKKISSPNDNDECICIYTDNAGSYFFSNISEEILKTLPFSMFPNPSSDVVYLIFKTADLHIVTITDKKGKVLFKQSFDVQTIAIDISGYSVGEYRVTVDNGKQESTLCLIKNKE